MQWCRKRRLLWVIGSANHSLLISHYRLSLSDDETTQDAGPTTDKSKVVTSIEMVPSEMDKPEESYYSNEDTPFYSRNFQTSRKRGNPSRPSYTNYRNSRNSYPRVCYPSYPSKRYRPLQSLDWFEPRIPSHCQYYYTLSHPYQREQLQVLPHQQPYAYCWNSYPSVVYYPQQYVDDNNKEQEHSPNCPYIYPGYAFRPMVHSNSVSLKPDTGTTVCSKTTTATSCAANIDHPEITAEQNIDEKEPCTSTKAKKKRKRKRKRKSGKSVQTQDDSQNREVEENEDDYDELSGSGTVFSECLTNSSQQTLSLDNMSTTSSNVGHQELAECPSDQTPLHNSCHNQVLPNGNEESVLELKQDETPERTIKNQDQAKCNNHIQKNSYQQLFMDESDSQNHSDTGVHKVVALSQLASNVLSSTTQQDTAVPSSSTGVGHNSPTTHINHSIKPKRESQPRDFPHLPLVDNLFTANIIDDIIGGAMQEIKQQRLLNGPDVETEDKEDPLEFSKMVDEITRGVDGLTDNINRHSDVSISDVSSICLDDIPLDDSISSDPGERYTQENLMTGSMAPPSDVEAVQEEDLSENTLAYENTQGSGIMAMDNDWSQCNGYAEDEEDTRPTERELVTEIVFISETSFMDEETQQHYDPENTALTFETELNPDAPEFIPCAGFPISSDPTDNTSEVPDEMAIEEKKNDDSSNRYSDFEDRVDVSDSSDEILKSPSFKQFSLPNDANNSSSIIDSSVKTQEKTQPNEENLSIFSDTLVTKCETDNNLENVVDINSIPVISKEKQKTVIFGGDLFEDIDLDNTGNFSLLDDVFTSKNSKSQKTTQNEYLTQPSIVDAFCNDDMNFSDEEYVGERYMDHQQIYDPSKYKDYYQICSALDVPDSPMDIISQEKILNNLKSSTINSSPKVVTRDIAIVKPQEHHVKPDIKIEEDDDIPSALRSRIAEIVLHETDDISDCGSEDVETIGHRYETADQPNHAYVNQLSLAAEMLRTKQELPYDDQFKPVMGADGVPMVATLNHGTVLGTPSLHPRHHYYGNPCFEMEDVPPVRSKEVADSGVQSEESTDESEDCRRQWNNAQADDNSPNKASFGYKKFGTKSKPLSAMLKGKTDPLCLCCEIM